MWPPPPALVSPPGPRECLHSLTPIHPPRSGSPISTPSPSLPFRTFPPPPHHFPSPADVSPFTATQGMGGCWGLRPSSLLRKPPSYSTKLAWLAKCVQPHHADACNLHTHWKEIDLKCPLEAPGWLTPDPGRTAGEGSTGFCSCLSTGQVHPSEVGGGVVQREELGVSAIRVPNRKRTPPPIFS